MFKAIGNLLSSRKAITPRFTPPDNKHTESVPAFRAHLISIGLTETEASEVLVKRSLAGMWYLQSRGYSFSQILDMDASRYLAAPTSEYDYYDYCEVNRRAIASLNLRAAFGLNLDH